MVAQQKNIIINVRTYFNSTPNKYVSYSIMMLYNAEVVIYMSGFYNFSHRAKSELIYYNVQKKYLLLFHLHCHACTPTVCARLFPGKLQRYCVDYHLCINVIDVNTPRVYNRYVFFLKNHTQKITAKEQFWLLKELLLWTSKYCTADSRKNGGWKLQASCSSLFGRSIHIFSIMKKLLVCSGFKPGTSDYPDPIFGSNRSRHIGVEQ